MNILYSDIITASSIVKLSSLIFMVRLVVYNTHPHHHKTLFQPSLHYPLFLNCLFNPGCVLDGWLLSFGHMSDQGAFRELDVRVLPKFHLQGWNQLVVYNRLGV